MDVALYFIVCTMGVFIGFLYAMAVARYAVTYRNELYHYIHGTPPNKSLKSVHLFEIMTIGYFESSDDTAPPTPEERAEKVFDEFVKKKKRGD